MELFSTIHRTEVHGIDEYERLVLGDFDSFLGA